MEGVIYCIYCNSVAVAVMSASLSFEYKRVDSKGAICLETKKVVLVRFT